MRCRRATRIGQFVADKTKSGYAAELLLRSAVERQMEIIGEALSQPARTEPDVVAQIPDFRHIVGMRNRLVHGYDNVDNDVVWDSTQKDVPSLRRTLESLLECS